MEAILLKLKRLLNRLATNNVVLVLLGLGVVGLLYWPYVLEANESVPPTVCLLDLADNPRTASVFSRGMLEKYGSENTFSVVSPTEGCHPDSLRITLVSDRQLMDWCLGNEICIVTGDENCKSPHSNDQDLLDYVSKASLLSVHPHEAAKGHSSAGKVSASNELARRMIQTENENGAHYPSSAFGTYYNNHNQYKTFMAGLARLRPNVILREYYSDKYSYPGISLGARLEFEPVDNKDRDKGNRPNLFNFLGSIKEGQELDRAQLRDVLNNNSFSKPFNVFFFSQLVRNPNTTTTTSYKDTLLTSSFTLAPVGTADDCFRFWEAIEAGSIPIYVRRQFNIENHERCSGAFEDVLASNPPIVLLNSWHELPEFMAKITEKEIEDMRQNLVIWNREWWINTTRTVDKVISNAIASREAANAEATQADLKRAEREINFSLKKLILEQMEIDRATKALKLAEQQDKRNIEKKQREEARLKKQSEDKKQRIKDRLKKTKLRLKEKKALEKEERKANKLRTKLLSQQRVEEVRQANGIDGSVSTVIKIVSEVASFPVTDKIEKTLRNMTFAFLHNTITGIIQQTGYRRGFLSPDEMDAQSLYMQQDLNQAAFLEKIIKAVAGDLDLPSNFVQTKHILSGNSGSRKRTLLCFVARAAQVKSASYTKSKTNNNAGSRPGSSQN